MGLLRQMLFAWEGSAVWKYLRIRENIGKRDVVIFLIEQDDKLNDYAFIHAEELLRRNYSKKLVFISPYKNVLNSIPDTLKKYQQILISSLECDKLKKYYQLVRFSEYVFFVTITWPESNWLYRFIDIKGVNKEDAVCLGVYILRSVPETGRYSKV